MTTKAKKHREFLQLFMESSLAGTFLEGKYRTDTLVKVIEEDDLPLGITIVDGRRWLLWRDRRDDVLSNL